MSNIPIPGASKGHIRRQCAHTGTFTLVRRFAGIETWQCLTCRKVSEVVTRPDGEQTCLHCGKPLVGRQSSWCCSDHGNEYAVHKSRPWWAMEVKRRDGYKCRGCGWRPTLADNPNWYLLHEMRRAGITVEEGPQDALGRFQLESHHITPLEWGGPEFDLDNGITLCNICHDQTHRELNKA